MNRLFIEDILAKITAELPTVKKSALFNNQFDRMDAGEIDLFNFPCIFLGFPEEVFYSNYGAGLQNTNEFIVRFHIGLKFNTEKDVLNIFDFKQAVFNVFHLYQPQNGGTMKRVKEKTDESRRNYYVYTQDYTCKLTDYEGFVKKGGALVSADLEVVKDVLINDETIEGIRTEDENIIDRSF